MHPIRGGLAVPRPRPRWIIRRLLRLMENLLEKNVTVRAKSRDPRAFAKCRHSQQRRVRDQQGLVVIVASTGGWLGTIQSETNRGVFPRGSELQRNRFRIKSARRTDTHLRQRLLLPV